MAGDLTRRADRFVDKTLRKWKVRERRYPVEVALAQQSINDRIRERRRSLSQHSKRK